VARVRAVPPGLPESAAARFWEGRWRADLGDLAGASLAFGRLRDAVELLAPPDPDGVAALLVEAAELEEQERGDLRAAQQSLGLALRLRPRDPRIASSFRRVAAAVAQAARPVAVPVAAPPPPPPAPEPEPPCEPEPDEAEDELRAQRLTERLRADPGDHATAMELAAILERLGRDMDLLALLSARMEEGDDEARAEVVPQRREVLRRLALAARAEGRPSEADLYDMMADAE
jgi:hypothetical protein